MRHVIHFTRLSRIECAERHRGIAPVREEQCVLFQKTRWLQQVLVNANIVQLGLCSLLRLANGGLPVRDDRASLAAAVVHITGQNCLRWTDDHTRRFQILLDPVRTEIALGRGVAVGIDIERIVGAGLHATFAADTATIVEVYDSIRTAEEGVGGTNLNARSVVAVVTSHHAKVTPGLGELAGLHVLHPCSKDPDGDLVFLLARHGAGVAPDTSILVDNEPVAHKRMAVVLISLPSRRCTNLPLAGASVVLIFLVIEYWRH